MTAATTHEEQWRLGYVPALDGMRGIAILLVMLEHANVALPFGTGNAGVTIFFVLSGFLITALLLQEHAATGRISLGAFYRRRAVRLLPALVAALIFAGVLMVMLGRGSEVVGDSVPALLYYMNWVKVAREDVGLLSHTWSLSIEEQFYIAWPLVLLGLLAVRRSATLVAIVTIGGAAAVVAWRFVLWSPDNVDRVYWATDTRADALLIGCALASLWFVRPRHLHPYTAIVVAAALAVVTVYSSTTVFALLGLPVIALATAAAVTVILGGGRLAKVLSWRPLVYIGTISYGLYLFHRPMMRIATSDSFGWWLPIAISFGLSFGAAWLSWRYIERPFQRFRGRREMRPQVAARNPAAVNG